MSRKEPQITRSSKIDTGKAHAQQSQKDSFVENPTESSHQENPSNQNRDHTNLNNLTERTGSSEKPLHASNERWYSGITIPIVLYFAIFVLTFLKKINYDFLAFISILQTPDLRKVAIGELVVNPLLQAIFLFVIVAFLLWCIRLIGIGKSIKFRRTVHSAIATLFVLATLIVPQAY